MAEIAYDKRRHPILRRGARGDAVVHMQRRLAAHLDGLDADSFADGIFGPGTAYQLKRFQKQERLAADGVCGRNTWTALLRAPRPATRSPVGRTAATPERRQVRDQQRPNRSGGALGDRVLRALKRKGYEVLDDGKPYHLNIVGVRHPSTDINKFDDRLVLVYRDEAGQRQAVEYPITTDPGEYYTKTKLLNKAGAAILVPGQYVGAYKLAKHGGRYEALCQRGGKVRVWRDGNRDDRLNRSGTVHEGMFGINIHRGNAAGRTARVGRYSAGCQVFQHADDFAVLISLAKKSAAVRGNSFAYTLLEEADLA